MSGSQLYSSCNQQLEVYGSFEAQSVNLMRTFGSLRDETPVAAIPAANSTLQGADYSSCAPVAPAWGTIACADDGSSVYNYQEFGASYSFTGVPADSGYNLTLYYQNFSPAGEVWPPPPAAGYYYIVQVFVNGAYSQTVNLSPYSSSASLNLGSLPANPSITLNWINNGWPPPGGSTAIGSGPSPGFIPWGGNPTAYDPNFEIQAVNLSASGTPPGPPPGLGSNCSNHILYYGPNYGRSARISPRPTCAAEVFEYSPAQMYLSSPTTTPSYESTNSAIQIYNLPPVL
jgi:hypothetical protein